MTAYVNYTNLDAGFIRGYEPGDRLVKGWEGQIDHSRGRDTVTETMERIFAIHNRDDRPDGQLCPSMSVGDVVNLDGIHWYTVESIGFERVTVERRDLITDRTWREVVKDPPARFEERNGKWVVIYRGTVVGRHTAKFRAKEQADQLNS